MPELGSIKKRWSHSVVCEKKNLGRKITFPKLWMEEGRKKYIGSWTYAHIYTHILPWWKYYSKLLISLTNSFYFRIRVFRFLLIAWLPSSTWLNRIKKGLLFRIMRRFFWPCTHTHSHKFHKIIKSFKASLQHKIQFCKKIIYTE